MTGEEKQKAIDALKISTPIMAMTQKKFNDYIQTLNKIMDWLEQEPKTGHWILQPSNKEQGERDFIWWKCSKCGQVIYSETEKDRRNIMRFAVGAV